MKFMGHVALSHADLELHVERNIFSKSGDRLFRVKNHDMLVALDVLSGNLALLIDMQSNFLRIIRIHGQANLLDVEDNVSDILKNAMDRRELMLHAGNLDGDECGALEGGKKDTAQSIANGRAEPPLQRFADETPVHAVRRFVAGNLFRLDELGPVPRINKAIALFNKHASLAYLL